MIRYLKNIVKMKEKLFEEEPSEVNMMVLHRALGKLKNIYIMRKNFENRKEA